jgi:hypothetical protein
MSGSSMRIRNMYKNLIKIYGLEDDISVFIASEWSPQSTLDVLIQDYSFFKKPHTRDLYHQMLGRALWNCHQQNGLYKDSYRIHQTRKLERFRQKHPHEECAITLDMIVQPLAKFCERFIQKIPKVVGVVDVVDVADFVEPVEVLTLDA